MLPDMSFLNEHLFFNHISQSKCCTWTGLSCLHPKYWNQLKVCFFSFLFIVYCRSHLWPSRSWIRSEEYQGSSWFLRRIKLREITCWTSYNKHGQGVQEHFHQERLIVVLQLSICILEPFFPLWVCIIVAGQITK